MEELNTLRSSVKNFIEELAKKQGINNCKIIDIKTNQKGEGYLGEIFMVIIEDEKTKTQLDVVIKAAFIEEKVRDMVPIRMSFQNEIYFYKKIYPVYQKLEKEHGILDTIDFIPKCLMVREKDMEEMLVLENLKSVGFECFDKVSTLGHDHVKLIFETYGRLHAYSYVLKDQYPEQYSKIGENLYNVYGEFMKKEFFGLHLIEMVKIAAKSLRPVEDEDLISKLEKYSGQNIVNVFNNIVTKDCDYSTILHGDCWSNNMLFKYEDVGNGRHPTDIRLIDFQLTKIGSPVCDLSYCLYSGGSKKTFDDLNKYLTIYYDSFSTLVRRLGSNPETLFPFSALKEHWRKYSVFGMSMAFAILKMKLTDKEDIVDLRDGFEMDELISVVANSKFDEEGFNDRIRGLLRHMSEIDAL